MTTQHTPGPWKIDAMGNVWGSDTKICEMSKHPGQDKAYRIKSDSEHADNAVLISVAPEMKAELSRLQHVNAELLEALKEISQQCPHYKGDYTRDAIPSDFGGNSEDYAREMQAMADAGIGDIARAAIAKATGAA